MNTTIHEQLDAESAPKVAVALGLTPRELEYICTALGRTTNRTELAVFAGMWSEHCSYKSTRHLLKTLPREGRGVLAGPGSHAGVVDVGGGWAVAFKVESHNHPSAVEPYQGAATGVGGILRDVIAQGARPCAVMDALAFGTSDTPRNRHIRQGVVEGIAGYGNAFGVPNVGGITLYDPRYEGNPLVNAMAAGMIRPDALRAASGGKPGDLVLYVGATTGRDGILGAAFASEELGEKEKQVEDRSHIQVGDPFAGKRLMEACLSFDTASGLIAGQDMGACGLTCAASETAALCGTGIRIDLNLIPAREAGMTPHEILLSESQERFLFVVAPSLKQAAIDHFQRRGVHAVICGELTSDGQFRAEQGGQSVIELPAVLVAGGTPQTPWPVADELPQAQPYPAFAAHADLSEDLCALLAMPGIYNAEPVYSHYDQTVGNRTVRGPGQAEAAVLKLPDSQRGFALVMTGRGEQCAADPRSGAQAALGEAVRRLACVGARILAVTDGINHGSPQDAVENLRLAELVGGLRDGLTTLGIAVTGGNVSLYNESPHGAICPTVFLGAIGVVEDTHDSPGNHLAPGLELFWLGDLRDQPSQSCFGQMRGQTLDGPAPHVDLKAEKKLADFLVTQITLGRVRATKASGLGGMLVALAKLCLRGGCGAQITLPKSKARNDWALYGEYAGNVWAAVPAEHSAAFGKDASASGVPAQRLGVSGGDALAVTNVMSVTLSKLNALFSPGPNQKGAA